MASWRPPKLGQWFQAPSPEHKVEALGRIERFGRGTPNALCHHLAEAALSPKRHSGDTLAGILRLGSPLGLLAALLRVGMAAARASAPCRSTSRPRHGSSFGCSRSIWRPRRRRWGRRRSICCSRSTGSTELP